ncbi:hypothetical protein [Coleofasciculus sp. E2-BRE-01]|uniref:hypothetical protein n=1 Tax=Coleofasciculus sp. E2-BRE-01 TaxID=3069524 RepID=UPI004063FC5B
MIAVSEPENYKLSPPERHQATAKPLIRCRCKGQLSPLYRLEMYRLERLNQTNAILYGIPPDIGLIRP